VDDTACLRRMTTVLVVNVSAIHSSARGPRLVLRRPHYHSACASTARACHMEIEAFGGLWAPKCFLELVRLRFFPDE
jgi:hypothetical protein